MRKVEGDIFVKYGIYLKRLWDIWGRNCGIYCAKTMGYFIGYIKQKLWDIFGEHYGIYCPKLWDISGKTMGYIGKNMGYICKNMGFIWNNYRIYWAKTIS